MSTDRETLRRLSALEHKVDHLLRHLTGAEGGPSTVPPLPSESSGVSERVRELVQSGDQIGAIKQYRAESGADLATAKAVVDGLA
jgi:ribosomal protein L7/L12